jgi:hypothetical protein
MPNNEAQPEGQELEKVAVAEIPAQMTEQEIDARIETDANFRQKVNSGEIDLQKLLKTPGEAEPTPADQGPEGAAAAAAKEDEVLKIEVRKSELEGLKSPGELVKSWKESQAHIQRLETENLQFRTQGKATVEKLKDLETRINAQVDARLKAAEKENLSGAAAPGAGADDEDLSVYDPKKLREVSQTTKEISDRLKQIEERLNQKEQVESQSSEYNETMDSLTHFQNDHPELKTSRPLSEINREYGVFIEKLANLAGVADRPMEEKIALVRSYVSNATTEDKQIRDVADRAGIKLPDEFNTLNALLSVRTAQQRLAHYDSNSKQAIPFTIDEAYNHLVANGRLKIEKSAANGKPNPAQPTDPAERAKVLAAARKQLEDTAPDIPPGASGSPATIDNLSYDEQMKLLDTPTEELRSNPAKLKMVNDILKRLEMKPLSLGA